MREPSTIPTRATPNRETTGPDYRDLPGERKTALELSRKLLYLYHFIDYLLSVCSLCFVCFYCAGQILFCSTSSKRDACEQRERKVTARQTEKRGVEGLRDNE